MGEGKTIRDEGPAPSDFDSLHGRDFLAAERTRLANERTFLAYQRTALTLFVAGVTFIHFFKALMIQVVGWVFIPAGLMTVMLGAIRYRRTRNRVREQAARGGNGQKVNSR